MLVCADIIHNIAYKLVYDLKITILLIVIVCFYHKKNNCIVLQIHGVLFIKISNFIFIVEVFLDKNL